MRKGRPSRRAFLIALVACVLGAGIPLASASPARAAGPPLPSSDPFYAYNGPLAGIAPGTVLRTRTVQVAEGGTATPLRASQVLYRTTGELGAPTVTVATILRPAVPLPAPRIVAYQTAYDALGSECDPSYTLRGGNPGYSTAQDEEQVILAYVAAGYTVVVPDYESVQLDWGAGQESGYGTLDGIRAAERFLRLPAASTPVGMVGYSGGSIATEFAAELAPGYAPELHIVGAAAGGVPVDFFHNLAYINGSPSWSGVIPAVLVGLGRAFSVNFDRYLSPYGVQVTHQVKDQCINSFLGAYPGLTYQKLLRPRFSNIYAIPVFVRTLDRLIMGRSGTPKGPLLLAVGNADGTGDGVMVARDVQALAYTYCRRGVSVQFNEYGGDDHTHAAVPFEQAAFTFLAARLHGQAVADGCPKIAPGNSLAPLPVPSGAHRHRARVRLRYLGRRAHGHAIAVELWSAHGTLRGVEVVLRHGVSLVAESAVQRLGPRGHVLVLRDRRHRLAPGRYTLVVAHGHRRLLVRSVRVR